MTQDRQFGLRYNNGTPSFEGWVYPDGHFDKHTYVYYDCDGKEVQCDGIVTHGRPIPDGMVSVGPLCGYARTEQNSRIEP